MTILTDNERARLGSVLARLVSNPLIPVDQDRATALKALVLNPDLDAWESLYGIALNADRTLSLWQAVCNVCAYPSIVPVDEDGFRIWPALPTALEIIAALEYVGA